MEAKNIGEVLGEIKKYFEGKIRSSFGLYFRGQPKYVHSLLPSIFRQGTNFSNVKYREREMYREFKLLKSTQENSEKSVLEWLILMQHYGLPTRLLDWSQNLLVALYFSVQDPSNDGALFALEPITLNYSADLASGPSMFDHFNTQAIIRANLTPCAELKDFIERREIKTILQEHDRELLIKDNKLDPPWWQRTVETPVAIRPPIQNDRIFLQRGVFTIHGGKIFGDENIIKPIHIEDLKNVDLIKIKIPSKFKMDIQKELEFCGINEATLFPELDYQARYIKSKWTV